MLGMSQRHIAIISAGLSLFHWSISFVKPSVMVDMHVAERKLNSFCQTVYCDSMSLHDPTVCHYCAVSSVCDK